MKNYAIAALNAWRDGSLSQESTPQLEAWLQLLDEKIEVLSELRKLGVSLSEESRYDLLVYRVAYQEITSQLEGRTLTAGI